MTMKLITKAQHAKLLANGLESAATSGAVDHIPVVKLFTPDANCAWFLTEITPDDHDIAFGLCDLGLGFPELGYVSLSEIAALRGRNGLPVERDRHFSPTRPVSWYLGILVRNHAGLPMFD